MHNARKEALIMAYSVYQKFNIMLTCMAQELFFPVDACDDMGLFLYVPILSNIFNIDVLHGAAIFFILLISVFALVTGICFWLHTISYTVLFLGLCGLIRLCYVLQKINDLYVIYAFSYIGVSLILFSLYKKSTYALYGLVFFIGLICSFSGIVRIYSDLPVLIFCGIVSWFNSIFSKKQKIIAFVFCLIGYAIPQVHLRSCLQKREAFLQQHGGVRYDQPTKHLFWHNIYIGFGFLQNNKGIEWSDSCGANAATKVNAKAVYGTLLCENVTKQLVFNLFKEDRYFFMTTLFAKLGVIFLFFLLYFGPIGLICSYFWSKPWYIELAFFSALSISALPGLLTLPVVQYLAGFVTCTTLYVMYSMLWAVQNGALIDIRLFINKIIEK